jgi:hypothetical protein
LSDDVQYHACKYLALGSFVIVSTEGEEYVKKKKKEWKDLYQSEKERTILSGVHSGFMTIRCDFEFLVLMCV